MKKVRYKLWVVCLSVMAVAMCSAQSDVDPNDTTPEDTPIEDIQLEMNFKDAPLQTVVEYLSEKAGLVILADAGLDRRLTVISRSPVNVDEAIGLIDSVLKDSGYSAVRQGRTLRIVTLEQARLYSMPVVKGNDPNAVEASDSMEYRILPVRYRSAEELAENLQPLMPEYAILQANTEGNVLLITDTRSNIKRILEIVHAMDQPMSAVAKIQVFRLRNADAASTAELIGNIFEDTSTGSSSRSSRGSSRGGGDRGRGGGPGGMFEMMRARMGGGDRSDSNNASVSRGSVPVSASADSRTNSVVVSASEERMVVIEQMIQGLDTATMDIADVKVYHLEYADAENTAELINDVFGNNSSSRSSNQQSSRSFRDPMGMMFGRGGGNENANTSSSGSNAEVIASADQRTNSIVVSGPPETLVVIEQIIEELDANPEQERQIFPYPLKNANAANVMEILNSLFDEIQNLNEQNTGRNNQTFQGGRGGGGQSSSGSSTSTSTSSSGGLDEETYFEADEETNTLLVMTSAKNYKRVKPIIDELDLPVGQVLIKVLFAEVVYSDSLDLGAEFSSLNLVGAGETELNFGGQGNASDTLTTQTLTSAWTVVVDALEEKGQLNVLSRPYILTSNNQLATISVVQEIPIPTDSTVANGVTQVNFEYREDIGITLDVTPSINPNGLVNMTVTPKITTRTNETLEISTGVFAEAFATRSATTKVAILDGQTIVIGGLIEDQIKDVVKKVPLLGDLPLLGGLFRHKSTSNTKTELLIFLTPTVAKDAEALTPISDKERSLSNIQNDQTVRDIYESHMRSMEATPDPNEQVDTLKK